MLHLLLEELPGRALGVGNTEGVHLAGVGSTRADLNSDRGSERGDG